ncbi:hypothetical protein GQR58_002005 [Nymphon striatum]|nr:hypothetical protein GQR58_002005 [Nymphon striatum]
MPICKHLLLLLVISVTSIALLWEPACGIRVESNRNMQRTFFITNNSIFSISSTLTVPVPSVSDNVAAQFLLVMPSISYTISSPLSRSSVSDRRGVFSYIETFFEKFGINGRACLQRTICEVAEYPSHKNGLFGDMLDLVLSFEYGENDIEHDDYGLAQVTGKNKGNCGMIYSTCPISIFNLDPKSLVSKLSKLSKFQF